MDWLRAVVAEIAPEEEEQSPVDKLLDYHIEWQGRPQSIQNLLSKTLPEFFDKERTEGIAVSLRELHTAILDFNADYGTPTEKELAKAIVARELDPEANIEDSVLYVGTQFLNSEIERKEVAHASQKSIDVLENALATMNSLAAKIREFLGPTMNRDQHSR